MHLHRSNALPSARCVLLWLVSPLTPATSADNRGTVEQPQACSISRRCMAAAFARASAWCWRQALCTEVPAEETSTHLESTSASQRGAAASLLDQSEVHGGCVAKPNHLQVQISGPGGKHSPPSECQWHRRARTLSPPPPGTVEQPQAASLLDQSEVNADFVVSHYVLHDALGHVTNVHYSL